MSTRSVGDELKRASPSQLDTFLQYVKAQQEHHRTRTFQEEYSELLRMHGVDPFRRDFLYLFDELSLRNSSRQRRDNVNVIGNTPDAHEFGTEAAADCR